MKNAEKNNVGVGNTMPKGSGALCNFKMVRKLLKPLLMVICITAALRAAVAGVDLALKTFFTLDEEWVVMAEAVVMFPIVLLTAFVGMKVHFQKPLKEVLQNVIHNSKATLVKVTLFYVAGCMIMLPTFVAASGELQLISIQYVPFVFPFYTPDASGSAGVAAVTLLLLFPLLEEILYRGVIYRTLRDYMPKAIAFFVMTGAVVILRRVPVGYALVSGAVFTAAYQIGGFWTSFASNVGFEFMYYIMTQKTELYGTMIIYTLMAAALVLMIWVFEVIIEKIAKKVKTKRIQKVQAGLYKEKTGFQKKALLFLKAIFMAASGYAAYNIATLVSVLSVFEIIKTGEPAKKMLLYEVPAIAVYLLLLKDILKRHTRVSGTPVSLSETLNIKFDWKKISLCAAIGSVLQFIISYGSTFVVSLLPREEEIMTEFVEETGTLYNDTSIFGIVSCVIVAPIIEEIVYRGIIHNRLRSGMPVWIATILSAVIFALAHGTVYHLIYVIPTGIILAIAYDKCGLPASIAMHMMFNLCVYIMSESLVEYLIVVGILTVLTILLWLPRLCRKADAKKLEGSITPQ